MNNHNIYLEQRRHNPRDGRAQIIFLIQFVQVSIARSSSYSIALSMTIDQMSRTKNKRICRLSHKSSVVYIQQFTTSIYYHDWIFIFDEILLISLSIRNSSVLNLGSALILVPSLASLGLAHCFKRLRSLECMCLEDKRPGVSTPNGPLPLPKRMSSQIICRLLLVISLAHLPSMRSQRPRQSK